MIRQSQQRPKRSPADPQSSRGQARPDQARENLEILERTQRLLYTNVQEALALEVGLLQLKL